MVILEESDGDRIMVARFWPRGRSRNDVHLTEWMRELWPGVKLLTDWKQGDISWQEYEKRYFEEMSSQRDKIRELTNRANIKTVTLLCIEKEDNLCCHRHLLKRLIEKVM
jgi:uncharacterized protein YeaO (DUF488 family)